MTRGIQRPWRTTKCQSECTLYSQEASRTTRCIFNCPKATEMRDLIPGMNAWYQGVIDVAVPPSQEHAAKGLNGKQMNLMSFSLARYVRESSTMITTRYIINWNDDVTRTPISTLSVMYGAEDNDSYVSFGACMSIQSAYAEKLCREHMRPR
jgi:hypothetical protein